MTVTVTNDLAGKSEEVFRYSSTTLLLKQDIDILKAVKSELVAAMKAVDRWLDYNN